MRVPLQDLVAQYQATRDAVMPAVLSVIERQQFIMGPEVAQLKEAVARLCRTRHAVGCASGTDAILLPLKALGLKPGDEVITTAFTFFAPTAVARRACPCSGSDKGLYVTNSVRASFRDALYTGTAPHTSTSTWLQHSLRL